MDAAAILPSPMALMTVAAPLAIAPPAQMLGLDVCPGSALVTIPPFLLISNPGVVMGMRGLGLFPMAMTAASKGTMKLDPWTGIGFGRPAETGSPRPLPRDSISLI